MAKSTNSEKPIMFWTSKDLASYNIEVHLQSAEEFLGHIPNTLPRAIKPGFLTYKFPSGPPQLLLFDEEEPMSSISNNSLLLSLYIAGQPDRNQNSAIQDFECVFLSAIGFQEQTNIFLPRYSISFFCGEKEHTVILDLCLLQWRSKSNITVLLIVESGVPHIGIDNLEGRVIAKSVAAFQYNNRIRVENGLDPLDRMTFPAIVNIGTLPVFYKIPVTRQLEHSVTNALHHPTDKTEVLKYMIGTPTLNEGMEVPGFRREILQNLEAFRKVAKECYQCFVI
ncbi:hypothetical protein BDN70DRAFT_831633 [Pholiota conissans]|uniref:Uncharacterized protein n=1 Tax=Pholiota conissans TaxID=109636 RepID=A0A9P6CVV0_9AGAR|nr:hypothetical protein BDN70DRAFT_831633 [Pholiota conissans]